MAFYSFVAFAEEECGIQDPLVLLGPGRNAFTAHTTDVEALVRQLTDLGGVRVVQVMNLSDHEPAAMEENLLLPNERQYHQLRTGSGDDEA